jgi:ribonucleotide reductase alpha subunit
MSEMYVTKRDGRTEEIAFDKILRRVKTLGAPDQLKINYSSLVIKVIDKLCDKIKTTQIDLETADQCASLATQHPDYGALASRILLSNHQKNTNPSFSATMEELYNYRNDFDKRAPLINSDIWRTIDENREELDAMIVHDRDYLIDYFGFKTLERAYLLSIDKTAVERPQYMWLRVALSIHGDDLEKVKETYDLMSQKYFTHATPTLFNAGSANQQMSSCYLMQMESDSLDGIYNTLHDCASISKWSGGIGLHIHNIRAKGSRIQGTNGTSTGIVPMLRVFNETARYVDQGSRRKGSFAIYLEPWHADIEEFLEMKKNHGDENMKARDLFYALWIPDLFMQRVQEDKEWTLLCPNSYPGLSHVYGAEFVDLYEKYEKQAAQSEKQTQQSRTVKARDLWYKILDSQMETGTPYMLYKDAINHKSNQKNIGVIQSSNLCTEITEYSDENETAVCNLASIGLPMFVDPQGNSFDYEKLHEVCKVVTANLNKVIDINFYPTPKTKISNMKHRPIGIGVQGLADTFALLDIPFHSDKAKEVNTAIFETIYHAALEKSCEIAQDRAQNIKEEMLSHGSSSIAPHIYSQLGRIEEYLSLSGGEEIFFNSVGIVLLKELQSEYVGAYSTFTGSPAQQGVLQFDMWNTKPSSKYDWGKLKEQIQKFGLRNSLLVAPMPTASTSQILGFNECFEPFTSNIYKRGTLAGEFTIVNKYLMKDLIGLNMWNEQVKNNIIANGGSVQQLTMVPEHIRNKYKTVWEIPMRHVIDMAADRGAFICQSQSMNLWVQDPTYNILNAMHFHSWKKGLKTGIYYLRRKAKHQTQQFTIEPEKNTSTNTQAQASNEEVCEMCSS